MPVHGVGTRQAASSSPPRPALGPGPPAIHLCVSVCLSVCVCPGAPKERFASLQNVNKRQSNSYISTLRFHPPRTTGNAMFSDHFSRLWTLRTSIWHSKTNGSETSIFAFCKSRFTIGNIRCIQFFQSAKKAMRIRYATRATRLPKWSRDPFGGSQTIINVRVRACRFRLLSNRDLP